MKTRARAWWVSCGLLALMCCGLLTYLRPTDKLLVDGDTRWIISEINIQHNPWRWFYHDWPIGNHFYRPLSTEVFELDNWLHPHNDYLWGITGDILCIITTVGLFWLLRELTDSPVLTTITTGLFCLWQTNSAYFLSPVLMALAICVFLAGMWRHRRRPSLMKFGDRALSQLVRGRGLAIAQRFRTTGAILAHIFKVNWRTLLLVAPPALIWYWLGRSEISGVVPLGFRMLAWIPGRTASSMTACAFISLAAFARYMRLQKRRPMPATALDKPNTRSSEPPPERPPSVGWPILAVLFLALSLLCYEQAVMVPVILGLIGLAWHFRGATGRWWLWGIPFGIVLLAYVAARHIIIPPGHSWYFNWQKRTSLSAFWGLQRYMFFFLLPAPQMQFYFFSMPIMFIYSAAPWVGALDILAAATAFCKMHYRWILAGFGWLGSVVAYGPMAWFKDFEHYHYFPMAFRALFDVMMAWIAIELTVSALSPRARQAPPRLSPAPGSLLHQ